MQKNKVSKLKNNSGRNQFTTIDDALEIVPGLERLTEILKDLGSRKHPLAVRRGVITGIKNSQLIKNVRVKGKGCTYFLDLQKAKTGIRYLRITQSKKGSSNKFERSSIYIFPDDAKRISEKMTQMIRQLK